MDRWWNYNSALHQLHGQQFCARWIRDAGFEKKFIWFCQWWKSMTFFQTTSGVALMMTSERTAASSVGYAASVLSVSCPAWKINNAAMYWIFEFLLWRYSSTPYPNIPPNRASGRAIGKPSTGKPNPPPSTKWNKPINEKGKAAQRVCCFLPWSSWKLKIRAVRKPEQKGTPGTTQPHNRAVRHVENSVISPVVKCREHLILMAIAPVLLFVSINNHCIQCLFSFVHAA